MMKRAIEKLAAAIVVEPFTNDAGEPAGRLEAEIEGRGKVTGPADGDG